MNIQCLKCLRRSINFVSNAKFATKSYEFSVVEVGPRDGLQNEKKSICTSKKVELIERLVACGLRTIETTSFVSPKWVPQMADHLEVVGRVKRVDGVLYPVLVPNILGLKNALATECVKEIAVITAASQSFSLKNVNCSMEDNTKRACEVTRLAVIKGIKVRGYISCAIGCPYDGLVKPEMVVEIAEQLLKAGCYEISLGDTIGVGSAGSVSRLLDCLKPSVPFERLAVHFHDTYGQALSNVLLSMEKGIKVADSSIAGLGGCPYAKGASGNLATEDLIYMLNDLGVNTGINLDSLIDVGNWITNEVGCFNKSKVAMALNIKRNNN